MTIKTFVKRVFTIFATNALFLRVIANLQIYFSILCNIFHVILHFLPKKYCFDPMSSKKCVSRDKYQYRKLGLKIFVQVQIFWRRPTTNKRNSSGNYGSLLFYACLKIPPKNPKMPRQSASRLGHDFDVLICCANYMEGHSCKIGNASDLTG